MGEMKSSMPVAIVIELAWQRPNVAMGMVTASAHCYCGLLLHIQRFFLENGKHIERYMISTQSVVNIT
jgi:hypothetical protein